MSSLYFLSILCCLFIIPLYYSNAEKIGMCPPGDPPVSVGRRRGCNITCYSDEMCAPQQKCCADGCSRTCKEFRPLNSQKPGVCPPPDLYTSPWNNKPNETYVQFKIDCLEDMNCEGNQKCCLHLNTYITGLFCKTPLTIPQTLNLIDRWVTVAKKIYPNLRVVSNGTTMYFLKQDGSYIGPPPPRNPESDKSVPKKIVPQSIKNLTKSDTTRVNKPISVDNKPISLKPGNNSSENYNINEKKSILFQDDERDQTGNFNDTEPDQYDGPVIFIEEKESETDDKDQDYIDPQSEKNPVNTGTKAGECPIPPDFGSMMACDVTCSADSDCPGKQKCCQYGCKTACFDPNPKYNVDN